jgi:hypothetical protein
MGSLIDSYIALITSYNENANYLKDHKILNLSERDFRIGREINYQLKI